MNTLVRIVFVLVTAFIGYVWYRIEIVGWRTLSDHWYITTHTEAGYLIRYTDRRENHNFEYIGFDGVYFDKDNNTLYFKTEFSDRDFSGYGKFYLHRYEVFRYNHQDTVRMGNKTLYIRDLDFVPAWQVMAFGL